MPDALRVVEIQSSTDSLLLPWLDLYETAFPPVERVLVSRLLEGIGPGMDSRHMLAAVDEQGCLAAIQYYADVVEAQATFLWYFAVVPALRGQGWGAWLYQALLGRLQAGERALFFDVESPAEAHSPEEREIAERRIRFYQRQGASVLTGVRYVQQVGAHQPPLPMHLMVHPLQPLSAQEVYEMARRFLPDALNQTGELGLA